MTKDGQDAQDQDTDSHFSIGGSLQVLLNCTSNAAMNVTGSAHGSFKVLGVDLDGSVSGSGGVEIDPDPTTCLLTTAHGTVEIDIEVSGKKEWPTLTFIANFINPAVATAMQRILPQWILSVLGDVYVQGTLSGSYSSDVQPASQAPWLSFTNTKLSGGPGVQAGIEFKQVGAELDAYAGVSGSLSFSEPGSLLNLNQLHFDNATITGEAGYELKVPLLMLDQEGKFTVTWQYPPQAGAAPRLQSIGQPQWHIIPHNTASDHDRFHGSAATPQAFAARIPGYSALSPAAQRTISSVLGSNIYAYAEPSLAVDPTSGHALLLWVYDDPNKPVMQSLEIEYSLWNGSSWSTPAAITNDTQLDSAPQVAWTGSGTAVAVWQRIPATLPTSTTWGPAVANQIEIATSTFTAGANAWSPVSLLTTNNVLDNSPSLARNGDGQALAVWHENAAGQLSGSAAQPDQIMASFNNSGTWSSPAVAVPNIPGLVDFAAGYGSGAATIAYTQVFTPTGSITPTTQLYTSAWNGTGWSAPVQQLAGTIGSHAPQVVYNSANQPLVVVIANGTLLLRNLTTGATTTLALPPDIGSVDEVHVVQDGAGNIAAVFTAQATQRDLYVSYNDQADNLWGAPVQLTDDTNEEASPTAGLDSSGNLLAAYASTAIVPVAHTVTVNGQTITYTVPTRGQTNLITLSHAFAKNLTLTDTDLALSDDRPAPGATVTISATVRNTGDLPLSGVTVDFYDGNPAAGGTTISTVPVPGILAAGGAATLTVPYTVPTTGGPHTLYAVADPSHSIAGANEQNTTGKITAFGPDLDLSQATVAYWGGSTVGIQTTISNIGTSTAPASTLAVYAGSLTGTRLLTNTVPPLAAGQTLTLTTPWNFGARAAGAYPLALAVNQSDFPEANQTNNTAGATLDVAPDLMVSPYYLSTSQSAGGAIQLSATVFNVGSVAAPAASIAIYADTPLSATTTIAHGTLPALAPGASTTYTATLPALPSGAHTLYVAVNPNRSVAETGYANNLASLAIRTAAIAATGGWSLIDLPLTATGPVSASTILQGVLHSSAGHLAAIYGLSNGRWSPSLIQQGSGATSGTDFALQPGQGYLLYTDTGTSYTPAAGAAGQVQRQGGRGAGARLATLVEPGRAERPGGRTRRALQRNRGAVALWIRRA